MMKGMICIHKYSNNADEKSIPFKYYFLLMKVHKYCRSCLSTEDQLEQTKRRRKHSNLKLNIPNHPFNPTLDSEGSVMTTNSTGTPDPYTLQYLSFMSRRAESGLVDFNRYPQQNGNFDVFRPMAPEIGRQLDMNSYSMSTRYNLNMDNNIYQQSDCLSSPMDEYRRSEVNIKTSILQTSILNKLIILLIK